ncbi:MAG TPA: ATP-binding protein [Methanomassiliicoccales archaeon]|nr:ATP-binding protein [Methanomassiliicoccales archaeon]
MTSPETPDDLLVVDQVRVNEGPVQILDAVDLKVRRGEIHVILGPHGSGKSTLLKVIAGIQRPSGGTLLFQGKELRRHSPERATKLGIEAVLGESTLYPNLTICQIIALVHQPRRFLFNDSKTLHRLVADVLRELSPTLNPDVPIRSYGAVDQQLMQFAKAVCFPVKLLLVDELSMRLPPRELERVRYLLTVLSQRGTTILYATHNMEEVFNFASRVTVVRNRKVVDTAEVADIDRIQLVQRAYWLNASRDELTRSNFELFYLKSFYEGIFNSIPFPVLVTDTRGNVVLINSRFREVKRFADGPVTQRSVGELLAPSDEMERVLDRARRGDSTTISVAFTGSSGLSPRQEVQAHPLQDEDSSFIGVLFIGSELSPGSTNLAPSVTNDQGRLVGARLAHEIRNPLGIILNYLTLIRTEESIQKIRENARNVETEVRRIKSVAEEIFGGRHMADDVLASVRAVVNEVAEFVRPTAVALGVRIELAIHSAVNLRITEELLKQVILNLVINSLDAMSSGGVLTIVDAFRDRTYVLSVGDTGTGIPVELHEKIFDPFFTTKSDPGHQGLGLAISKDIISRIGGWFDVQSTPGTSTVVSINFPWALTRIHRESDERSHRQRAPPAKGS